MLVTRQFTISDLRFTLERGRGFRASHAPVEYNSMISQDIADRRSIQS
jgi:hypothetical protein